MKTLSPALIALFQSRSFFAANLFTITLASGVILRYTSYDRDLSYNGNTYSCGGMTGPYFERSDNKQTCTWKSGLEVSTLQFDVIPGTSTIGGVPFLTACVNGVFDGAWLQRERAYMATATDTSAGTVILDVGRVAELTIGRSYVTFSVNDPRELLTQDMPIQLYQASCVNSLYDATCSVSRAANTYTGAATSGSTNSSINTNLTQPDHTFDLGVIAFTSGQNNGVSRSVKSMIGCVIRPVVPFPYAPGSGDAFSIYRGCAKTQTDCVGKFNNLGNFRAFPFVPTASTAY